MQRFNVPSGTINGTNKVFTLTGGFSYVSGSIYLILNGVTYQKADPQWGFSETNNTTITLTNAPFTGDVVIVIFDDGEVDSVAYNVDVQAIVNSYQIDWNASSYTLAYNLSSYQIHYNPENYTLSYNAITYNLL